MACFVFPANQVGAQNPQDLKPEGYVNDYAGVLSPQARDQLSSLCAEVDHKAQAQIAVVTVKSLGGRSVEEYSLDLATHFGVGPKGADRGVLILLAVEDHKYRFEVGYGLEGILPDGKVGGFGREAVPLFRENNYDAGLLLMTRRVADVIASDRGVALSPQPGFQGRSPDRDFTSDRVTGIETTFFLVVGLFIFFRILRRMFLGPRRGRGRGWWIGPMMGGWGGGGFGGGGWSGGGGFGGFGGGSFGGGGASGSW